MSVRRIIRATSDHNYQTVGQTLYSETRDLDVSEEDYQGYIRS